MSIIHLPSPQLINLRIGAVAVCSGGSSRASHRDSASRTAGTKGPWTMNLFLSIKGAGADRPMRLQFTASQRQRSLQRLPWSGGPKLIVPSGFVHLHRESLPLQRFSHADDSHLVCGLVTGPGFQQELGRPCEDRPYRVPELVRLFSVVSSAIGPSPLSFAAIVDASRCRGRRFIRHVSVSLLESPLRHVLIELLFIRPRFAAVRWRSVFRRHAIRSAGRASQAVDVSQSPRVEALTRSPQAVERLSPAPLIGLPPYRRPPYRLRPCNRVSLEAASICAALGSPLQSRHLPR